MPFLSFPPPSLIFFFWNGEIKVHEGSTHLLQIGAWSLKPYHNALALSLYICACEGILLIMEKGSDSQQTWALAANSLF